VAGVPVKSTIRVHSSAEEGNHPGTCVVCRCPGGVAFRAATPWRNRGRVGNPQSAVEELANFCDVSSSHELRTNPLAVDESAKSWNTIVLQPVPGDGTPAHATWRGCQPPLQGPQLSCLRPTWQGADLVKRDLTADAPARKLVGDITYIHTREGFVYPAGRDGAVCSKRTVGYATAGKHANRIGSKSPGNGGAELPARQGCDDFSCRVRGTQYTSADYTASMNNYVFLASVGRTGVCYDNAAVESFNATRAGKNSSTRRIYRTRRKAIKEVASWIEH